MKETVNPRSIYVKRYNDEKEKCSTCPYCGNRDSLYGHAPNMKNEGKSKKKKSSILKNVGIYPYGYYTSDCDTRNGWFKRTIETLFGNNLYQIFSYVCPKCNGKWESDPILVMLHGENVV